MSNPIAKLVSRKLVSGKLMSGLFQRRGGPGKLAPQDQMLKLRARDREDFAVVSAVLQDALVPVVEMAWLPQESRFALVANRFRWERRAPVGDLPDQPENAPANAGEGGAAVGPDRGQLPESAEEPDARFEDAPLYERVHCGVTFDRVEQVAYRGFTKNASGHVLELLAVVADDQGLTVTFAGEAALRLQGARVVCHLEDLGEPWPTQWRPSHGQADQDTAGAEDLADPTNRAAQSDVDTAGTPDKNRNGNTT